MERPVLDLHEAFEPVLHVEYRLPATVAKKMMGLIDVEEDDTRFGHHVAREFP